MEEKEWKGVATRWSRQTRRNKEKMGTNMFLLLSGRRQSLPAQAAAAAAAAAAAVSAAGAWTICGSTSSS